MTSDTWFDVCILLTKEKNKIWTAKLQRNSSKTKPLICVTYMVVLVCNWLHVQISNLPDCSTTGDVDLHVCVCMCICVATHTLDVSSAMLGWVIPGKTQWHKIISMALFPSSHSISPKHILTGTALALYDHSCPTLRFHQRTYIYIYIHMYMQHKQPFDRVIQCPKRAEMRLQVLHWDKPTCISAVTHKGCQGRLCLPLLAQPHCETVLHDSQTLRPSPPVCGCLLKIQRRVFVKERLQTGNNYSGPWQVMF